MGDVMAKSNVTESTGASNEKAIGRVGWWLFALSLATPFLFAAMGLISAFVGGQLSVYVFVSWLVAAVTIDIVLRKRSSLTKSKGRIVAAALSLVVALATGFSSYLDTRKVDDAAKGLVEQFIKSTVEARNPTLSPSMAPEQTTSTKAAQATLPNLTTSYPTVAVTAGEANRNAALLSLIKARAEKFASDTAALERSFAAIDLGSIVNPENLVSHDGIRNSRKKIDATKVLIDQRKKIIPDYLFSLEQGVRSLGLTEGETIDVLAGMKAGKGSGERMQELYEELGNVQFGLLQTLTELLNVAERNLGRTSVKDGQLLFFAQPELDEYLRHFKTLNEIAAKEEIVSKQVNAQAQQNRQGMVDRYLK